MFFIKETPRRNVKPAKAEKLEIPSLKEMFITTKGAFARSPALLMTVLGAVSFHLFLGAAMFEQIWFVEERGFERNGIAELTGWIALVAGVLGNLFGGVGGDYFLKKTGIGRPMFLFWVTLFLMPVTLTFRLIDPESPLFMFCMFMHFFQFGSIYGPVFGTIQELVPPQVRGTITAVALLLINVLGLGLGVTAGGIFVDWLIANDFNNPYTTSMVLFNLISFVTIPLFFFAGRRFVKDRQALQSYMDAK